MDSEQLTEMMRGITERLSRAERDIDDLQLVPIPPTSFVYNPNPPPGNPSIYDDEFNTGLLDPKWTAINCATGTVDLLSVAAAKDTWDATMFTGMMALQPGRDDNGAAGLEAEAAILRQTIALGATCKVVIRMDISGAWESTDEITPQAGILLSGVTGFDDNEQAWVLVSPASPDAFESVYYVEGEVVSGGGFVGGGKAYAAGSLPIYVMIMKTGNDYSMWAGNGRSWGSVSDCSAATCGIQFTNANALTRLSLFCYWSPAAAATAAPNPIGVFDYVRYFTNNSPLVNA